MWPRKTGRSLNGWASTSDGVIVSVRNRAPYAGVVNNANKITNSNKPNPNKGAVERSLEPNLTRIFRKVFA